MCGITGILAKNKVNQSIIHSMTDQLRHRGPDQKNHWINNDHSVLLGHTRLSILDLSINGLQPMISSTGRYVITYNGEIYNHLSLRKKLKFTDWKSTCDTETILQFVEEYGFEKTLESINGMFAFAIWDRHLKKLFLARDRIGEKPLYYGFMKNKFIFSSELKPIKKNFKKDLILDRKAIHIFLQKGYIPHPFSIFKNIYKLEPGSFLIVNKDKISIQENKKYFNIKNITKNENIVNRSFEFYKTQTFNLLEDSVKKQMLSDAPIGAFLSSGIDSSIICSLMQKNSINKINTFTIGFEDQNFNEANIAKSISNFLGTNHQELFLSKNDLLNIIPNITSVYDEPFADSSQIPTIFLSSLASKSVKVALTGDGADELFGGYQRYSIISQFIKISSLLKIPISLLFKIIKGNTIYGFLNLINNIYPKFFNYPIQKQKIDKLVNLFSVKHQNSYEILMNNFLINQNIVLHNNENFSNKIYNDAKSPLNFMLIDLQDYLPNDVLCKVDRAAMYNSLETRAPFLDNQILSFSQQIPEKYKINKNNNKIILRSIQRDLYPQNLCSSKKIGFGVPLDYWLKNDLTEWVNNIVNDSSIEKQNILNKNTILKRWYDFKNGNNESGLSIWYICILQSWLNDFFSI